MSYGGEPFPTPGLPIYVERLGAGRPVVCVHGFGLSSAIWRPWTAELRRGHELLLVDLKGSGRAPKPADGRYSPVDHAELVARFLVTGGLTDAVLLGHSLGGGVILLAALLLRDRGDEHRISGLVSVSGAAYPQPLPPLTWLARLGWIAGLGLRMIPKRWMLSTVRRTVVHDPRRVDPRDVEAYAAPLRSPDAQRALRIGARQIVPDELDHWTRRYPEIDHPTLLLWGRSDPVVPVWVGERLHQALPRSELVVLEECGHLPMEERTAASLTAVLRFLDRLGAGTPEARP